MLKSVKNSESGYAQNGFLPLNPNVMQSTDLNFLILLSLNKALFTFQYYSIMVADLQLAMMCNSLGVVLFAMVSYPSSPPLP